MTIGGVRVHWHRLHVHLRKPTRKCLVTFALGLYGLTKHGHEVDISRNSLDWRGGFAQYVEGLHCTQEESYGGLWRLEHVR